MRCVFVLAAAFFAITLPAAQAAETTSLPTGQQLHPVGQQVPLGGTLPLNVLVVRGAPYAITTCGGALQGLTIVDTRLGRQRQFLPSQVLGLDKSGNPGYVLTESVFYGLAISPDRKTVYASRGGQDQIGVFQLDSQGYLTKDGNFEEPTGDPKKSQFPTGIAVSPDGKQLYAANNQSDTLAIFDTTTRKLLGLITVGGYPLAVAATSKKVYVTSERDGVVTVIDPVKQAQLRDIPTGSEPDALVLNKDQTCLWVANGSSDTVTCIDTRSDRVLRTILLRPAAARGLPGATPTGLALSPDGKFLYVTLADTNAVAMLRLSAHGDDARLMGYIPTGWYPTSIAFSADGKMLYVTNGKGSTARIPNPQGPGPFQRTSNPRYVHDLLTGTLSMIPVPNAQTLAHDTRQVLVDNGIGDQIATQDRHHPQGGYPAPILGHSERSGTSLLASLPIKHVLYIIKENRTYDQVLGDISKGNGDASLTLFGRAITPNQHALAEQFVLLDNFYACAEVSSDGWNWSTSGMANAYTQRNVPENYREGRTTDAHKEDANIPLLKGSFYDYEGQNRNVSVSLKDEDDVAESPGGYIWDTVAKKHLTYRNYGCFLDFKDSLPTKPVLANGHTEPNFPGYNMKFADSDAWVTLGLPSPGLDKFGPDSVPSRYTAWKHDFDKSVAAKVLPTFEIIRLPRDHTSATTPGADTPQAMVADNDYAVGQIVDAVSHSPFWKDTAIFIVEDDAQNGPDHIDCHRTTAYVISPYIKHASVDHHFYNTDSLLHTMELILKLPPMTRYDAVALPFQSFVAQPDLTPFQAIMPIRSIFQKNPKTAYGAARSLRMNLAQGDRAPEQELNEILWHSIKGKNTAYPGIRR